jgi:prepilin-type N-terminal cleavage/methylation domain-containing protein
MRQSQIANFRFNPGHRGFTLIEVLVVVGILVVLLAIFIPYAASIIENNDRVRCADNLRKIGLALSHYATDNRGLFPRVRYDFEHSPHGYTAFTGPDAADPFAEGTSVAPNDVTASLWLLVRDGYISSSYSPVTSVFICPSARDYADPMLDDHGQPTTVGHRSNFRKSYSLGYSYASPFSDATGYGMVDFYLQPGFVIAADRNPGIGGGSDVTKPSYNSPPMEMVAANSRNHGRAGQNVLFAGTYHVEFRASPYCGANGDNIYTAMAPNPVFGNIAPNPHANGYCAPTIGPAWQTDSYLVPTDQDDPTR